jgi:cytochrome c nitrite reductase small subunit
MHEYKNFIKENYIPILFSSIIIFTIIGFGLTKTIEYTESPQFCAKCHTMDMQYKTWMHSKHRSLKCIDCHLPNDNIVNHFLWKAIDGTKDVISQTLGLKEEDKIFLSEHGKKVLQKNCIRCHKDMVSHINQKRNCTDCHINIKHRNTALLCSFNTEVKNEKK